MVRFRNWFPAAALLALCSLSRAVILYSNGDPSANTTAPTGLLTDSGWQYEGQFGWFLGTAISPHHFITVKHIGIASNVFVYKGANYTIVQWSDDPMSDLRIFEVAETLPSYAPLYSRSDENGRSVVVVGRGTQRGDPVYSNGILRGWLWGPGDGVQRWGENQVRSVRGNLLYATFDQNGGLNEAHLSSGDSGGATFINDAGVWKLAGINYAVDNGVSTTPGSPVFDAALFDTRWFYDAYGQLITGSNPVPNGFYAIRMSDRMQWIQSIISGATPTPTPSPTPTPNPTSTPTPTPAPTPTGPAVMLTPVPGSTFGSSSVTFTWSAGSANAYALLVGTSPGSGNIYTSSQLSVRSITANNIPTDGRTIYVRLYSRVNGSWVFNSYTYHAFISSATPTPTPTATPTPTPTPTATPTPPPTATPTPTPTPTATPNPTPTPTPGSTPTPTPTPVDRDRDGGCAKC
jgi:hypothetical protein